MLKKIAGSFVALSIMLCCFPMMLGGCYAYFNTEEIETNVDVKTEIIDMKNVDGESIAETIDDVVTDTVSYSGEALYLDSEKIESEINKDVKTESADDVNISEESVIEAIDEIICPDAEAFSGGALYHANLFDVEKDEYFTKNYYFADNVMFVYDYISLLVENGFQVVGMKDEFIDGEKSIYSVAMYCAFTYDGLTNATTFDGEKYSDIHVELKILGGSPDGNALLKIVCSNDIEYCETDSRTYIDPNTIMPIEEKTEHTDTLQNVETITEPYVPSIQSFGNYRLGAVKDEAGISSTCVTYYTDDEMSFLAEYVENLQENGFTLVDSKSTMFTQRYAFRYYDDEATLATFDESSFDDVHLTVTWYFEIGDSPATVTIRYADGLSYYETAARTSVELENFNDETIDLPNSGSSNLIGNFSTQNEKERPLWWKCRTCDGEGEIDCDICVDGYISRKKVKATPSLTGIPEDATYNIWTEQRCWKCKGSGMIDCPDCDD